MLSLYLIKCKGMQSRISGTTAHGIAYVIAKDAGEAYKILRDDLDKRDLGFSSDRAMDTVELIAQNTEAPECGIKLYIT